MLRIYNIERLGSTMGRVLGLALGAALVALCIWMGAEGVALVNRAKDTPAFTDPVRARALRAMQPPDDPRARSEFEAEWRRDMAALSTGKWALLDRGRGLVALAATGLATVLLLRLWDARNLARARTPPSARAFLLLGVLAWAGLVLAGWPRPLAEFVERGRDPYWSENTHVAEYIWAFVVLAPLPVAVGFTWLVFLQQARLPASLWLWDRKRPAESAFWTAACGVLLLPFAAMLAGAVSFGYFLMVPPLAVLIYLVLSARAAVLSGADAAPLAGGATADRTAGTIRG